MGGRKNIRILVVAMMFALVVVPLAWWASRRKGPPSQGKVRQVAQESTADSAKFAHDHFKAVLEWLSQSKAGCPSFKGCFPALQRRRLGLKVGDVILEVDGKSTEGQALSEILEWIGGFAMASVDVVVQRDGTNSS